MNSLLAIRQRARGDLHRDMSIPAYYYVTPSTAFVMCSVRVWRRTNPPPGAEPQGSRLASSDDRVRFLLTEFPASRRPRYQGIVSVAEGEAYRIDHLEPVDGNYQTALVTPITTADITSLGLEYPADE